ncbi:MAG: DUF192 domain-containing protein [Armatimonadetes bacterium]|nr:DUF192 domain-containing protein [Armatimonadota bacterium]MDW8120967.1 DUF192 domain-containing protein [Armatimonadota bacterium]
MVSVETIRLACSLITLMWLARIENKTKQTVLCTDCIIADGFVARTIGLMGRSYFPDGAGLLLLPAKGGIHTFFMKFPIDAAYLDTDLTVVAVKESLPPWKLWLPRSPSAFAVLEVPSGTLARTQTTAGDLLRVTLIRWIRRFLPPPAGLLPRLQGQG